MQVWGITHRGAVRSQNQDAYDARQLEDGRIIALVCDGMGGARAGNVASTMAVELFMKEFQNRSGDAREEERMQRAAALANKEIFQRSIREEDCTGMGTTLVAALVGEREAVILNEGDSRAYHINQDGIVLITRDHSLVEEMVRMGEISKEQARNHPEKNIITKAIGVSDTVEPDYFDTDLQKGECLLMCSDGLSNMVSDGQIKEIVDMRTDLEYCAKELIRAANHNGGRDNIAVVLIERA